MKARIGFEKNGSCLMFGGVLWEIRISRNYAFGGHFGICFLVAGRTYARYLGGPYAPRQNERG